MTARLPTAEFLVEESVVLNAVPMSTSAYLREIINSKPVVDAEIGQKESIKILNRLVENGKVATYKDSTGDTCYTRSLPPPKPVKF